VERRNPNCISSFVDPIEWISIGEDLMDLKLGFSRDWKDIE
jgi:hypothetical protein